MQQGGGIAAAERGEADGFGGGIRNLAGRWPDADVLLQGGMSEGLRDWDLWGPLIFCLLLSLFLSRGAKADQRDLVFSGIFAMVWIGEAVVTLQIKLLGGNMYVEHRLHPPLKLLLTTLQCLFPVHLDHWLHALPTRHCLAPECSWHTNDRQDTSLPRPHCMVFSSRSQHHGRLWSGQEPCWHRSIPSVCFLHCAGLHLLHQLSWLRVNHAVPYQALAGVSRTACLDDETRESLSNFIKVVSNTSLVDLPSLVVAEAQSMCRANELNLDPRHCTSTTHSTAKRQQSAPFRPVAARNALAPFAPPYTRVCLGRVITCSAASALVRRSEQ